MRISIKEYINKISDYGFNLIFKEPIIKDDDRIEYFYVYWHVELGILLKFDTYHGSLNNGNFYYNWLVKLNKYGGWVSSGRFYKKERDLVYFDKNLNQQETKEIIGYKLTEEQEKHNQFLYENYYGLWLGEHDCRNGIIQDIESLKRNGKLLSNWIEPYSFLYLAVGSEYTLTDRNHEEISLKRLKQIPENVKEKICYEKIIKNQRWISNITK